MGNKHSSGVTSHSTGGGAAYPPPYYQPQHATTASASSGSSSEEIRHPAENAPVIPSPSVPLWAMNISSSTQPTTKINISSDRKDFTGQHLSLQDMQQLWKEVQRNPFIGHIMWGTLPLGEEAHTLRTKIEQRIIQNNQEYKRYPSDFIHGLLSSHVYQNTQVNEKVTFPKPNQYDQYLTHWTVNSVHDLPQLGKYYAVSYKNEQTRQLVLAHRGTTVTWSDLFNKDSPAKTDLIGVLGGEIVAQQKAAYLATKDAATYAKENNYHFSTTGHSLGAWLAEMSVYYSVFEFGIPAKAVTFDSPGSIKMKNLHPNIVNHDNARDIRDLDIVTYLSDPNFVNTCNRHIGQVYRVYPNYQTPIISRFTGSGREGFWSLWGHSLDPLLATFDPATGKPAKFDRMVRWPVITYTPRVKEGTNMLTEMFRTASPDASGKRTITSLLNLIGDVWTDRIDQTQYLACWNHLSASSLDENTPAEKVLGDQFSLKYQGSYEPQVKDPLTGKLVSHKKGSADWYLKKLHDCPPEKIAQYFGENNLITRQLIALKEQYRINIDQGQYQLVATNHEEIRERILRLLDVRVTGGKVKTFLETHAQHSLVHSSTLRLASYLPPSLGSQYISRMEELDRIDKLLADHAYVIISGEPGFGKTSLAIEYGHQQKNHPNHASIVIKIDADSREKIDDAYRRIATELGIHTEQQDPEMIMRLVHSQISNSQKKVLLLFDNVESHQDIAPFVEHSPDNIKALITTRHSRLMEGEPVIKVKPFTHEEAKQYITSSTIKDRISSPQEVEALVKYYAKDTDYVVPYYLNRAIGIIKQQPIGGITNYLAFIKAHPDDEGELILQQRLLAKARVAWPMLQYAAYLDPDFIDLSIFEQLFYANKDVLNEAIRMLESLSAMYVVRKEGQEGLSLHRLTQGIVKAFINNPSHQQNCLTKTEITLHLVQSLNELCPVVGANPGQDWQQAKKLMPHVDSVLAQIQDTAADDPLIAELLDKRGSYTVQILGLYQKAHKDYQKALAMRQRLYHNQPCPEVALSLNNLGLSYADLGGENNIRKGLTLLEQALAMRQGFYPDQPHPAVANSLNDVGYYYGRLGGENNIRKGLTLLEQALAIWQRLYPDQPHPEVATSLNRVGISYVNLGGIENRLKGLALQEQALAMRQRLYPDQPHPHVAASLHNVGVSYANLGGVDNIRKGLAILEQALAMRQRLYPDQPHPDVANSLNNVGYYYERLGGANNIRKGLTLQEQALAIWQKLYPDQPHPDVAKSLHTVGYYYAELEGKENIRRGLALLEQALAMRQRLYPDQPHPDVASSLNSAGTSYVKLGGVDNIRRGLALLEQALAMWQRLYPDQPHPAVATLLNNVGTSYVKLGGVGNIRKGLTLLEQALAMRQRLYPDQPHPDVANSLHTVGYYYAELGGKDNIRKGLALLEQALVMRQRLYPDQPHPQLVSSLNSAGNLSIALGQTEKGQDYLQQAKAMQQKLKGNSM
jgi:tetratricopeptide (TPR) repeat protein